MAGFVDYMQQLLFGGVPKKMEESIAKLTPKQLFDPYGSDYDYDTAKQFGLGPDASGHWPSRVPDTGMLLKGIKHETWPMTLKAEQELGNKVIFKDGRYYSIPDDSQKSQIDNMSIALEALKLWKGTNIK